MNTTARLLLIMTLIFSANELYSVENRIVINKAVGESSGTAKVNSGKAAIKAVELPETNIQVQRINPVYFKKDDPSKENRLLDEELEFLDSASAQNVLFSKEYMVFELDMTANKINKISSERKLSDEAFSALEIVPNWLVDQLKIKFTELYKARLDDDYAQLILDAGDNIKDEVAFCVANMSYQSLRDSRFSSDKEMIVRNAEHIYKANASLQYVELVEYGSIENRDYYTTTKYRIYDAATKDTVWSEIPRDMYYWYIVHPKLDQEGVYVTDNSNDASGQRTYGYSWREFLWDNPDAERDYTQVNITTSKGTVSTIPVLSDLMKSPSFLWNRTQTYLPFGREFAEKNSAMDQIGNWCSQALPVDVQLPRAFQPNQVIMKHNGNCNEDAFLVAAACRTALIPFIYLSSSAEDHVYGALWDEDWYHFEFFRGGLQVPGNDAFGITNMMAGGGYGWETSMVQGFRPDGFILNFTKYYADLCNFKVTVIDSKGTPIDGAMVQIFAPYGNGYNVCNYLYTNRKGELNFDAGYGKQYLVNVYHPKYGWSPTQEGQAFYLVQGKTVRNGKYQVNVGYADLVIEADPIENLGIPEDAGYSVELNFSAEEIITGISEHDNSQKSRFYKWNGEEEGIISFFVCDEANYQLLTNNESFEAYNYTAFANGGEVSFDIPNEDKSYLVFRNNSEANIFEKVSVNCKLMKGSVQAVDDDIIELTNLISPNPFNESCRLDLPPTIHSVKVYNSLGLLVDELEYPFVWNPDAKLANGIYMFVADKGDEIKTSRGVLNR
ncbi:MAG: hypothetical protein KAH48_03715 [Chlorobi bacterium]|nr:hypothetical protein [Chlorobiota bacterium]